ncbi:hypothetical protein B0H14DRAFT_2565774 [Mycena olivaceomarginata]|nr:hypothetical protein B0H14DRAFT_2565774 [Mycena olivaceomarginata]
MLFTDVPACEEHGLSRNKAHYPSIEFHWTATTPRINPASASGTPIRAFLLVASDFEVVEGDGGGKVALLVGAATGGEAGVGEVTKEVSGPLEEVLASGFEVVEGDGGGKVALPVGAATGREAGVGEVITGVPVLLEEALADVGTPGGKVASSEIVRLAVDEGDIEFGGEETVTKMGRGHGEGGDLLARVTLAETRVLSVKIRWEVNVGAYNRRQEEAAAAALMHPKAQGEKAPSGETPSPPLEEASASDFEVVEGDGGGKFALPVGAATGREAGVGEVITGVPALLEEALADVGDARRESGVE